jgi:hypothetical protein
MVNGELSKTSFQLPRFRFVLTTIEVRTETSSSVSRMRGFSFPRATISDSDRRRSQKKLSRASFCAIPSCEQNQPCFR